MRLVVGDSSNKYGYADTAAVVTFNSIEAGNSNSVLGIKGTNGIKASLLDLTSYGNNLKIVEVDGTSGTKVAITLAGSGNYSTGAGTVELGDKVTLEISSSNAATDNLTGSETIKLAGSAAGSEAIASFDKAAATAKAVEVIATDTEAHGTLKVGIGNQTTLNISDSITVQESSAKNAVLSVVVGGNADSQLTVKDITVGKSSGTGNITATLNLDGDNTGKLIEATGTTTVNSKGILNIGVANTAEVTTASLTTSGEINVDKGSLTVTGTTQITGGTFTETADDAQVVFEGATTVTGGNVTLNNAFEMNSALTAGNSGTKESLTVSSNGKIILNEGLTVTDKKLTVGTLTLNADGTETDFSKLANAEFLVQGTNGAVTIEEHGEIEATTAVNVTKGTLTVGGTLTSAGDITLNDASGTGNAATTKLVGKSTTGVVNGNVKVVVGTVDVDNATLTIGDGFTLELNGTTAADAVLTDGTATNNGTLSGDVTVTKGTVDATTDSFTIEGTLKAGGTDSIIKLDSTNTLTVHAIELNGDFASNTGNHGQMIIYAQSSDGKTGEDWLTGEGSLVVNQGDTWTVQSDVAGVTYAGTGTVSFAGTADSGAVLNFDKGNFTVDTLDASAVFANGASTDN